MKHLESPSDTFWKNFQKARHIPNLDGLRGVSILLILLHHLPDVQNFWLRNLQINGVIGVHLFFVISGFLICTLAVKEVRESGSFNMRLFYIRRILRLFPLYYLVLLFVCFLVFVMDVYTPERKLAFQNNLPSYIFYYANVGIIGGPFSLVWSLSVEEQFYLLFSLLFITFKKETLPYLFTAFLIFQLQPFVLFDMDSTLPNLLHRTFNLFEPIFMGVILALAVDNKRYFDVFYRRIANRLLLILLAFGILLGLILNYESTHLYNIALTLIVGICALSPPLKLVGGKVLSHIGKISYGIYLFHTIIFSGIKNYLSADPFEIFIIGFPLAILCATLSYYYFERPILQLKDRFFVKKRVPENRLERV